MLLQLINLLYIAANGDKMSIFSYCIHTIFYLFQLVYLSDKEVTIATSHLSVRYVKHLVYYYYSERMSNNLMPSC